MTVPKNSNAEINRLGASSLAFAVLFLCCAALCAAAQQTSNAPSSAGQAPAASQETAAKAPLPRGKKLMLKDGTFQLVREYHVDGDRVRYYSIDQMDWEEIPESMVDWDATRKVEMDDGKRNLELIAKARETDKARHAEVLDVDASIEVAPKVFLPAGAGMFEFDGKAVYPMAAADPNITFSMAQKLKQVLVPIPVVPTRHAVSLDGPHARFRLHSTTVEFYMRTADGHEPNLDLIRAKVHGGKRTLENLDQIENQTQATGRITLLMQRWEIAHGVYRFTLEQSIDPGEYALAETVYQPTATVFLWDFGVDSNTSPAPQKPK
jgi:hypothetical protein